MRKKCKCKAWKRNIPIINSAITLAFTHGMSENLKPANFCLWCGKKLVEVEE